MRFNARKLILAGASLVIILTAIASLIYASRPSDNGKWINHIGTG